MIEESLTRPVGFKLFAKKHMPTDLKLILTLERLIERYFREKQDVGFYCAGLQISLRRLNYVTMAHLQKTVSEMLQERRRKEAIKLLKYTTLSIKEIAFELGFNDSPYFIRYFKRTTGKTPRNFRCYCAVEAEKSGTFKN